MWTIENRPPKPLTTVSPPRCDRDKLRYPSDVTDEEWLHMAPLIPLAKRGGRKRTVDVREVVNGVMLYPDSLKIRKNACAEAIFGFVMGA